MKVYIAKDWTGPKVFKEPPHLIKCGGSPIFGLDGGML